MPKSWWPWSRKEPSLLASADQDNKLAKADRYEQLQGDIRRFEETLAKAKQLSRSDPKAATEMYKQLRHDMKMSSGGRKRSRARRRSRKTRSRN
jgi:hypothetical protein